MSTALSFKFASSGGSDETTSKTFPGAYYLPSSENLPENTLSLQVLSKCPADPCVHTQPHNVPCRAGPPGTPRALRSLLLHRGNGGSQGRQCCLLGHRVLLACICRWEGVVTSSVRLPPSWSTGHRDPTVPSP